MSWLTGGCTGRRSYMDDKEFGNAAFTELSKAIYESIPASVTPPEGKRASSVQETRPLLVGRAALMLN